MSVPVRKRTTSSTKYIYDAKRIVGYMADTARRFPPNLRKESHEYLISHALNAFGALKNTGNIKSNDYLRMDERIGYFNEAFKNYYEIFDYIDCFYDRVVSCSPKCRKMLDKNLTLINEEIEQLSKLVSYTERACRTKQRKDEAENASVDGSIDK